MKIYVSIHIGSYGISLKVFEISKGRRLKKIDEQRRKMDIAVDIIRHQRLSRNTLLQMTDTLCDMKQTIDEYRADAYDVYAGSIFLSAGNIMTLTDQVREACGMSIKILDNPRQKFLLYEALCSVENFSRIIDNRTVVVDVGGNGVQLSLFEKGRVSTTQHIYLGAASVWDDLRRLGQSMDFRNQLMSMINMEMEIFYSTYLNNLPPENMIIINNPFMSVSNAAAKSKNFLLSTADYIKQLKKVMKENAYSVFGDSNGGDANDLFTSFLMLYRSLIEHIPVKEVYVLPISLHEGMAYDYAYNHRFLPVPRDFEGDCLQGAWAIAERYNCDREHINTLLSLSGMLYDSIKKRHGMPDRCGFLLKAAVILHDCGKYISLAKEGLCTYTIITSSEILGLSDKECLMVAWICYFFKDGVKDYDVLSDQFTREEYFTIQKLTAILSIAGALDRSHTHKAEDVKFRYNGRDELAISIDTQDSMELEKVFFDDRAELFEDIFAIRPVLKSVRVRRSIS